MLSTITPYDWITNPAIIGWIGIASLVIGILAIIIGVFTGYWFYRKAKPLKRITYNILSDIPVVSIKHQVGRGNIKIEYEDNSGHIEEISDARLLTLTVSNTGNSDIKIWNSDDTDIEIKQRGKLINGKIGTFEDIINERNRSESIITWAMQLVFILVLICIPLIFTINAYLLITTVCTLLLLRWVIHRIAHPFKCACGYKTRFTHRFKKHVLQTHHGFFY